MAGSRPRAAIDDNPAMGPVFLSSELRTLEHEAQLGLAPGTLMARAGHGAAAWMHRWVGEGRSSFVVLCGPGNNGGDGYVCARHLIELGHDCLCWAPVAPGTDDARQACAAWANAGGRTVTALPRAERFDVVVDAMFGIGLARPLGGEYLEAARWARSGGGRTVALDVPSGLDADTGRWVGAVAGAPARATVSFLGDKPGLHMADGCDAAGFVHVDRLGVAEGLLADRARGRLNAPGHFEALLESRPANSHKGRFGSLAVIGGASGMTGAALLAARAALRLGCGRVYVSCVGRDAPTWDPQCPELMFRPLDGLPPTEAIVAGCGLGQDEEAQRALRFALGRDAALVLDADALNLLAADPSLAAALAASARTFVITPHPLEAARLLAAHPGAASGVADRIGACSELALRLKAVAVLKGAGTVIVDGTDARLPYWVNPTGGPALASAGTGDVLSGMIGSMLAQGHAALASALGAVWLHGRSAQIHGADLGLLASEVPALAARELAALKRHR